MSRYVIIHNPFFRFGDDLAALLHESSTPSDAFLQLSDILAEGAKDMARVAAIVGTDIDVDADGNHVGMELPDDQAELIVEQGLGYIDSYFDVVDMSEGLIDE